MKSDLQWLMHAYHDAFVIQSDSEDLIAPDKEYAMFAKQHWCDVVYNICM